MRGCYSSLLAIGRLAIHHAARAGACAHKHAELTRPRVCEHVSAVHAMAAAEAAAVSAAVAAVRSGTALRACARFVKGDRLRHIPPPGRMSEHLLSNVSNVSQAMF